MKSIEEGWIDAGHNAPADDCEYAGGERSVTRATNAQQMSNVRIRITASPYHIRIGTSKHVARGLSVSGKGIRLSGREYCFGAPSLNRIWTERLMPSMNSALKRECEAA